MQLRTSALTRSLLLFLLLNGGLFHGGASVSFRTPSNHIINVIVDEWALATDVHNAPMLNNANSFRMCIIVLESIIVHGIQYNFTLEVAFLNKSVRSVLAIFNCLVEVFDRLFFVDSFTVTR